MQVKGYRIHRRAKFVIQQLEEEEKAQLLEKLMALAEIPVDQWPAAQARKIPGEESLYLVPINDSLRAFVYAPEGQEPEVQWIAAQEKLDALAEAARNGQRGSNDA